MKIEFLRLQREGRNGKIMGVIKEKKTTNDNSKKAKQNWNKEKQRRKLFKSSLRNLLKFINIDFVEIFVIISTEKWQYPWNVELN